MSFENIRVSFKKKGILKEILQTERTFRDRGRHRETKGDTGRHRETEGDREAEGDRGIGKRI